jgi:hypothetical protein
MASLKGNLTALRGLPTRVNKLPLSLVHDVANRTAPAMTLLATSAFSAGRNVYGDPYGDSKVTGKPLTLKKSGLVGSSIRFAVTGTVVRCVLGPKYSKYLIGNYRILPMGGLPRAWAERIREIIQGSEVAL